jgi:hypothetical protein
MEESVAMLDPGEMTETLKSSVRIVPVDVQADI